MCVGTDCACTKSKLQLRYKPRTDGGSQWQSCRESIHVYIVSIYFDSNDRDNVSLRLADH